MIHFQASTAVLPVHTPGRLSEEGEGVYRVLPDDEADCVSGGPLEDEAEHGTCVVLSLAVASAERRRQALDAADRERRDAAQVLYAARERLAVAQRRYVRLYASLAATQSAEPWSLVGADG